MTEAEKRVLEEVLRGFDPSYETRGPLNEALMQVVQERTPPEFEETLRGLCFRAFEALDASLAYAEKSPLGSRLRIQFREEYDREKAGSR